MDGWMDGWLVILEVNILSEDMFITHSLSSFYRRHRLVYVFSL